MANWVLRPWLEDFLLKGKHSVEITTSRKCQIVQVSSILLFKRITANACAKKAFSAYYISYTVLTVVPECVDFFQIPELYFARAR